MFSCAQGGTTSHAFVGDHGIPCILDVGMFGGNPGVGDVGRLVVGNPQKISESPLPSNPGSGVGIDFHAGVT
jgi:hypothetical protein